MRRAGSGLKITVATLSVLLLGACGGQAGGGGTDPQPTSTGGGGGTQSQAPTDAPTPEGISVEEYSAAVTKAMKPVAAAFDELDSAKGYKGLERRITAVESSAGKAAGALGQLDPPADYVDLNSSVVTALEDISPPLSDLGSEVSGKSLCTGSVVRAGLGDEKPTSALREAARALYTKLPGEQPVLKLPSSDLPRDDRPGTGRYLRDVNRNARADFKIDNGSGTSDTVVILTKGKKPDISVYVRRGSTYTVKGVPDGTYSVFYKTGGIWDNAASTFSKDCAFRKFTDPLKFATTRSGGSIRWTDWTITLNSFGGNAPTDDVNPDDFPE